MTLRIPPWLALAVCTIAGFVALYLSWGRAFVANDRCLDDGGRYEERWDTCNKSTQTSPRTTYNGPTYVGELDGQNIELQLRDDLLGYRMLADGQRVIGDLNTERGHDRDPNATVYVLNPFSEHDRQVRFVVTKNAGVEELVLLGPDGEPETTHLKSVNN